MKKACENGILFAVVFFGILFFLALRADINIFRFEVDGEVEPSYGYTDHSAEDFATAYTANFPYMADFIDVNGFMKKIAGQREMNGALKLNNGHMTEIMGKDGAGPTEANAQAIIDLNRYCLEHGTKVLYIQPPYTISKYDPQLPTGVTDAHNEMIDEMVQYLREGNVPVIDLREEMWQDGISQYDLWFKTDHHWTAEGAFYAYGKIARWISAETGKETDETLLDMGNYQVDRYPQWHLGMYGQRTGAVFAGADDFDLVYPKFETRIRKRSDGSVMSLREALVKTEIFESRNIHNRYTYDNAYTANDVNDLESLDAKTDLNVWLLSDSFMEGVKPYFLLTYREFHTEKYRRITTRWLEKNQPDVLVVLPWVGYLELKVGCFMFVDDFVYD